MWWLDLEPERLLAIYCQEGQATEEPFHSAFCFLEDQLKLEGPLGEALEFDWSEDVQSEQCSDLKKGVMACIPDKVAHQVVITTWKGLAAVGIGFHWQGCLKAAYLALATTAAIKFQSVDDVQCLVEQSNHAEVLKPISSAEIYKFEDPLEVFKKDKDLELHAVVWHLGGSRYKGFFSSSSEHARDMYSNLVGSPCAAALFDKGELLMHYGRYDTRWWKTKLCNSSTTELKHKGWREKVRCNKCSRACEPWANYCSECGSRLRQKGLGAKVSARAPTDSVADVDMQGDKDASERDNREQH